MKLKNWKRKFGSDERGVILAEALIVVPFITVFAVGILEFGNVFSQRHLLEVGVRDAARYLSRCRPGSNESPYMPCSEDIAKNIALYGNPTGSGRLRVPNWGPDDALDIEFSISDFPAKPTEEDTIIVEGTMKFIKSPFFEVLSELLDIGDIYISYYHEERYFGW